ncbi:hypothetical protein [Pseudosulfitobacter pseudonitzschiae]|uniref:hypothetical protein n=1 Tax=Pseudosulfitobacter pseudonitzschiae TaxID=1402135 RepID=UPI003B7C5C6F
MKKIVLAASIAFAPTASQADTVENAKDLLSQWQPASVSLTDNGILRVVLNEKRISDSMYYAVIQGFCFAPLLQMSVSGVESVFVLNKLETQGWLFESGVGSCDTINNASNARVVIAGSTSTHTDTANGL